MSQYHPSSSITSQATESQEQKRINKPSWEKEEKGMSFRVESGRYVTNDLKLFFGSKNPRKECDIPDAWADASDGQEYSLHQRLAMVEPVVRKEIRSLDEKFDKTRYDGTNFIAATLSFVVSSKKHTKGGDHTREFFVVPIEDPSYKIFRLPRHSSGKVTDNPHSEDALFSYLSNVLNLRNIVNRLSHEISKRPVSYEGRKIYAVILDINSSHEMCGRCEENTYRIQASRSDESMLGKLESILAKEYGYKLPKKKDCKMGELPTPDTHCLHFVTRVTCSIGLGFLGREAPRTNIYVYPEVIVIDPNIFKSDVRKFFIDAVKHEGAGYHRLSGDEIADVIVEYCGTPRNIKQYANGVILHTEIADKYNFNKEGAESYRALVRAGQSFFSLPTRTIFGNSNTDGSSVVERGLSTDRVTIKAK